MIDFAIDGEKEINDAQKMIGSVGKCAPNVLAKAVNETAKEARKLLATKAQDTYAVKNSGFNKSMKIKNASKNKPTAIISSKGRPMELIQFKASPTTYKTGPDRPKAVKGKVIKSNSLKTLALGDIKAFIVQFKSGHKTIAQRKGKERLPIKTLYSPSIPSMIGNEEKVYGVVEPKIQKMLSNQVNKHVLKELKKAGAKA